MANLISGCHAASGMLKGTLNKKARVDAGLP
jgi:hypothetical protein